MDGIIALPLLTTTTLCIIFALFFFFVEVMHECKSCPIQLVYVCESVCVCLAAFM